MSKSNCSFITTPNRFTATPQCSFFFGVLSQRCIFAASCSQSRSLKTISGPILLGLVGQWGPDKASHLPKVVHIAVAEPRLEIHSSDFWLRRGRNTHRACCLCHLFHLSMSSYFRIKPIVWPSLPDHKKTLEQLCKKPKKVG